LTNGNIQIVGKNVDITDASLAFIENQGTNPLGAIKIEASDSLSLTGTTESNPIFAGRIRLTRGLVSQAIGSGKGADIEISTNQLVIQDSGRIYLSTFGSGAGGNLKIEASDSVQILGISSSDPSFGVSSLIATSTAGTGPAGRIELATQHLSIQQGGLLTSTVFSSGTGGNLSIKASESIVLSGYNPNSLIPSIISSSNQGSGQGGNLEIDTKQLILGDGGRVDASTLASGAAGSLTINATDFVKVSGTIPGSINPSLIVSSANRVDPVIQQGLGLPAIPTGASGNVTINTPLLSVTEGAQVTVRNDGTGDGGTLRIHADSIFLDGAGGITASTQSGEGGNITISSRDIRLRNNSEISATAGGTGNGGNIFIDTGTLVLLENSQIAANAFAGRGGNISIFADGVFVSFPDSKITASSQLGIDGNVQINTPETNLQSALEQINTQVISPEEIIAGSCLERRNEKRGSFVYAGMEGLPVTPQSSFSLEEPLTEIQGQPNASDVPEPSKMPPSSELAGGSFSPFSYKWKPGEPILEGGKIVRTREGKTLFVATPEQVAAIAPQGCSVTKTR
jgi:large exoprotein involved in heme utilization and adhesion